MQLVSVGQLTRYLKEIVETDDLLQDLWVYGEVSNLSRSPSGHLYFTLKEAGAQTKCVMFKSALARAAFIPEHGLAVICHGRVSLYEAQGSLQFYVDLVQPEGVGELQLEFERLRARLEAEGLFDPSRKRPLPLFPRRIGVVTSPTSAAFQDILQVLGRRYPVAEVVLAPTLVQGEAAAPGIAQAIRALCDAGEVDVIIVARGGGSLEELWPFNEEIVARAVFAATVPVISGVGHETDYSICDLVADRRAPTPSVAAELAVPDRRELLAQVAAMRSDLAARLRDTLDDARRGLGETERALRRASPLRLIEERQQAVDEARRRLDETLAHRLALAGERLAGLRGRLDALEPRGVLARGFAVIENTADRVVVRSVAHAPAGAPLRVQVADGAFGALALGPERTGAVAVPARRDDRAGGARARRGPGERARAAERSELLHAQLEMPLQ